MQKQLLFDWLRAYLKSRDAVKKEIVKIKETPNCLEVQTGTGKKQYLISPELPNDILLENHTVIVCLNTTNNFEWLQNRWNKLILFDDLQLIFVNPKSEKEHKWIINPHIHAKISEPSQLKQGLLALFQTVDPV